MDATGTRLRRSGRFLAEAAVTAAQQATWLPLVETSVDEQELRVLAADGDTAGVPVLMVHGFEDSWQSWMPLAERLAPDFRVLVADMPWRANGDYAWTEALTPSGWITKTLSLLPVRPGALIGHSFGSSAILSHLAGVGSAEADAVILTSPVYRPAREDITWALLDQSRAHFREVIAAGVRVRAGKRAISPELFDRMVELILGRIGPTGFVNLFRMFAHSPLLRLDQVRAPTLVLGGLVERSGIATGARELAEGLAGGSLALLQDFDHFCHVVQADEVAALVRGHLDDHVRR